MSNLSVWDIGRQAKLAGTTTVQTFNPADLTVRIRNNAVKMVRQGATVGYGQGSRVAGMLMERYGVTPIQTWNHSGNGSVYLPKGFNSLKLEAYDELMTLCKAGFSAWRLTEAENEHTIKWRQDDHKEDMEALATLREGGSLVSANSIYFYSMQKKALQCIEANRTDEYRAKLEEIVEYLHTNEPIHITTFKY
jgi:hypothetical protein